MIAGVDADTLAVGINATDGSFYFGAGAGVIDDTGITLAIAGDSTITPPIKWIDSDLITLRAGITAFNVVGDTDSLSFEFAGGGLNQSTSLGQFAQMVFEVRAHQPDTASPISSGDFYHRHSMSIQAGADSTGSRESFLWQYNLNGVSPADVNSVLILSLQNDMDTAGLFELSWNFGDWPSFATGWRGDSDQGTLYHISTAGAIFGGTDTNTGLDLGYLNEKAWTFASTATAGIEDPDNEMGKLWLDTDAEMRLTDTAGEDWFVTKSTSTGSASLDACRTYNSAAIAIPNNAWTALTFNSERFDYGSLHSLVANTGRITFPAAGVYVVNASLAFATNATGFRAGQINHDSTTGSPSIAQARFNAAADLTIMSISAIFEFEADDYIILNVYQNSGGDLNITTDGIELSPEFSAARVR